MLTLIVLMAAATASKPLPVSYSLPNPKRCTDACAEQYRLPLEADDDPTSKDRAMAQDGTRCNVVGAKRCLSKRRTILRSTEDPEDTLRGSFAPK